MGLTINIYRSDYDSDLNVFKGKKGVTVINVDGPSEPTDRYPAALLSTNAFGNPILIPVDAPEGVVMDGGTFAGSCDNRWRKATGLYAAIPIHDRVESWDLYRRNLD